LPFSECSCLKFSEDGGKLALGFANGKIAILNTNICKDTKEICRAQAEKAKDLNHESAIETIIWSNDGKYLKTLSRSNLLFFGIAKGNDDAY
jgi:WD40 repeat protein